MFTDIVIFCIFVHMLASTDCWYCMQYSYDFLYMSKSRKKSLGRLSGKLLDSLDSFFWQIKRAYEDKKQFSYPCRENQIWLAENLDILGTPVTPSRKLTPLGHIFRFPQSTFTFGISRGLSSSLNLLQCQHVFQRSEQKEESTPTLDCWRMCWFGGV